ncbi:hypothetical protein ACFXGA_09660 [Actinosynnema sp. NPDC059335]|uniref:hypothetical protein n=1 Tax=Actinosynnema sp. NPDC059335 TaxID=3346804 RepID=UPI00366F84B0
MSSTADSVDAQQAELGKILGLDGPASEDVLRAAVGDEQFARNILTCRRDPELLAAVLARPPVPAEPLPTSTLVARGASALARWARTGFTVVTDEVFDARIAACNTCPHRTGPQVAGVLGRLAATGLADKSTCALCGCVLARKARLPSEQCPAADPDRPGHTRWGDALPKARP